LKAYSDNPIGLFFSCKKSPKTIAGLRANKYAAFERVSILKIDDYKRK